MTKEEKKNMMIANCRICLLSKSNCTECPLNWALDLLDIEKTPELTPSQILDICMEMIEPDIFQIIHDDVFGK